MGEAARKHRPASYADIEALPAHLVGELVAGELLVSPRPALRHTRAASRLGAKLGGPFDLGEGGPGGWQILDEPELHLAQDIVVPDLAGWRVGRLPEIPDRPWLDLAPDWACEVLSPSTVANDRGIKRQVFAREGVPYLWWIDPLARTLEVLRLGPQREYVLEAVHINNAVVRAAPFAELELDLALLWG
ncbi:MAG: Uma2 family endonuclease [Proteobacteria bacterium]|nr:Uma2 family endonuclease [Pseudomonadota bacterium]